MKNIEDVTIKKMPSNIEAEEAWLAQLINEGGRRFTFEASGNQREPLSEEQK